VIAEPTPSVVLGRHLGEIPDPDRPPPPPGDPPVIVACTAIACSMGIASLAGLAAAVLLITWLASAAVAVPLAEIAVAIGAVRLRRVSVRLRGRVDYLPPPADARPGPTIGPVVRVFLRCWPLTLVLAAAAAAAGARGVAVAAGIAALIWFGQTAGYWVPCIVTTLADERRRGCRLWMPMRQDPTNLKVYLRADHGR
jgi:hypothetical protein